MKLLNRIAVPLYLALLAAAVPWYWPADDHRLWFGVPAWVTIAVLVSSAVSVLTACLLARPWPHEDATRDE